MNYQILVIKKTLIITLLFSASAYANYPAFGLGITHHFKPLTIFNIYSLSRSEDLGYGFQIGLGNGSKSKNNPERDLNYYSVSTNFVIEFSRQFMLYAGPLFLYSNTVTNKIPIENENTGFYVNGGLMFNPFESNIYLGINFTNAFDGDGTYGLTVALIFD